MPYRTWSGRDGNAPRNAGAWRPASDVHRRSCGGASWEPGCGDSACSIHAIGCSSNLRGKGCAARREAGTPPPHARARHDACPFTANPGPIEAGPDPLVTQPFVHKGDMKRIKNRVDCGPRPGALFCSNRPHACPCTKRSTKRIYGQFGRFLGPGPHAGACARIRGTPGRSGRGRTGLPRLLLPYFLSKQKTLPCRVETYSRPEAAVRPSNTGTSSNSSSLSRLPSAAE